MVDRLRSGFESEQDVTLDVTFGPVDTIEGLRASGQEGDLVITSARAHARLVASGLLPAAVGAVGDTQGPHQKEAHPMYRTADGLVLSPTDLTRFVACAHLTALDLRVADGSLDRPRAEPDEALELLFRKGLEHEHRYLASLREAGEVAEIVTEGVPVAVAAARTEDAMAAGAEVIYQATFLHGGRRGHADFLLRRNRASALGPWSYDVADTKLARRLKVPALLQMADYGEHLRRLQGIPPEWLTVVAGDGEQHRFRFEDVECYARRVAARLGGFIAEQPATTAEPVAHCAQCRWEPRCSAGWRRDDHLSLVAFMRTDHRELLEQAGIGTVRQLASCDPEDLPRAIGRDTRSRLVQQARLQITERDTGQPVYELLAAAPSLGLLRLPAPDPADLYLDFEGDPYVEPAGREYLAGIGDRDGTFTPLWAHSVTEERMLTERLVDAILQRWQESPGMHLYHYAAYERSALQRLTARHGVREAELDILLRAEVLVDLYAVVRQGLRISKESYSIKKMEAFYWGEIRGAGDVADAMSSVIAYERWLVEHDDAVLGHIANYNADDVRSTHDLHDWLEERRIELETRYGAAYSRPSLAADTDAQPGDAERAEAELAQRLVDADRSLLAGLVGWHRREARPAWWEVFRLEDLDDDELIEDGAALGGLSAPVWQQDVKRSHAHRYGFPPQDTKIQPGRTALDVDTHESAGTVQGLDAEQGWIDLKIGKTKPPAPSRGFGPDGPVNDNQLRAAIADVAQQVLSGQDCLGARLVSGVLPAGLPVRTGESAGDAVLRVGAALDGGVLAVQGPPGTGKSTQGARLIRALLDAGLKVGITALSHQVIGGLLTKVSRPALQRCNEDSQWCRSTLVDRAGSTGAVAQALTTGQHTLVGGTAWLWATDEMQGSVDVLVIDEAGQFSLANAVAVSRAATSMVLLGDPQQLMQPTQAEHPHGAGVSVLEHLLAGHDTVPPDRGIFLDTTWRMHPSITDFVGAVSYEHRLRSADGLDVQRLQGDGRFTGSGLRWVPVEHAGNASASPQEAAVVAGIVDELLAASWVDADDRHARLTTGQVLVVAPYNAQVARLRAALPAGVLVGTVDKFQGKEAAVVVYSLASSSADNAPRGVDFLYDVHRLNVAVSRARAMTILVGSPRLLDAEVHNPTQLRLVNALCRYVEMAS